jgi:hypothetical protein
MDMKMRLNRIAALLLFVVVVIPSMRSQTGASGALHGQVLDNVGAVIVDAHVIVHADRIGESSQAIQDDIIPKLDNLGRFSVQLRPGFFDVCVMDDAFTPVCQKILVRSGDTITRKMRLRVDPEVAKRLADRVY